MCTVLLPPGGNPTAVNKYIIYVCVCMCVFFGRRVNDENMALSRFMSWIRTVTNKKVKSVAARLLRLWVRIQPGAWTFVCCDCFVLSGRGLCIGLITRPEEAYRVWRVCDHESWIMRRPWPTVGCRAMVENKKFWFNHHHHHHHHVHEGLAVFPVPWSSKWNWSLHLFLGRSMFLRPFGLCCNACWHGYVLWLGVYLKSAHRQLCNGIVTYTEQ